VEDAYRTLKNLFYEGERRGFNFEKFIEKHMECYLELSRHNEPVNESKKVRDFLSRIKASELQAAVQQVRATPELAASLTAASNFINLSVVPLKQNPRNVGGVTANEQNKTKTTQQQTSGGRGNNDKGGRGRGKGWRGGRGGRGGHGRGRGRSQERGITHTGYYSEQDWQTLSRDQQMQVLEARGTKRSINGVETTQDDVNSTITELTRQQTSNDSTSTPSMNPQGSGLQFGRQSIGGIYSGSRKPEIISQLQVPSWRSLLIWHG
jgi:hypothetical protein